ncbi:MAG TPA: DUF433 domain-containing protein [Planctomycetaceae bacterium]|nr:DUF433 domain-containing protein [Planctomycetaceae bacterium]
MNPSRQHLEEMGSGPKSNGADAPGNLAEDSVGQAAATWVRACESLAEFVEIDSDRRGGRPVLKGTRVKISQILAELADENTPSDIADNLDLDRELLVGFLHALALTLNAQPPHENRST